VSSADEAQRFRSTQCIALPEDASAFDYWGQPHRMLDMLHAYFSVAERGVVWLVRIRWQANRPAFVLVWPPAPLITMGEPDFELTADRRAISVDVEGGWLVTSSTKARLVISLTRRTGDMRAVIDLMDYQPRGGHRVIVRWVYKLTQARLHAWLGRRYLRQFRRRWPSFAS
jgi:hypothetical protein